MKKRFATLLPFLSVALMLFAQQPSIDGHWLGTLVLPNGQLRLAVTISGSGGEDMNAVLTSLDQGMAEVPMNKAVLEGDTLTVEASAIGVFMSGPVSIGEGTWETTFKQGSVTSQIAMKKVEKIPGKE